MCDGCNTFHTNGKPVILRHMPEDGFFCQKCHTLACDKGYSSTSLQPDYTDIWTDCEPLDSYGPRLQLLSRRHRPSRHQCKLQDLQTWSTPIPTTRASNSVPSAAFSTYNTEFPPSHLCL